jgi:alanine racemase
MLPTTIEISINKLKNNYRAVRDFVDHRNILAVIKSNAYGHGIIPIAKALAEENVFGFGVNNIEEAIELRENDLSNYILIMGKSFPQHINELLENNIVITIASYRDYTSFKAVLPNNSKLKVHVKVDTGMGRLGFDYDSAFEQISEIYNDPQFEIEGIYSHFATADEIDSEFANQQLDQFSTLIKKFIQNGYHFTHIHMANSAGIITQPDSYFNMVRPGILLYGNFPSSHLIDMVDVSPILRYQTKVIYIRDMKKGDTISYGRKYVLKKDSKMAIIPAGYGDGLFRALHRNGYVLINSKLYSISGVVSMNYFSIDIGDDNVREGDIVTIIGNSGQEVLRIEHIAEKLNTVPYEITCMLPCQIKRVY